MISIKEVRDWAADSVELPSRKPCWKSLIQFRDRLYQMKRPRMTFSKSLARFESDRSEAVESRVVGLVWFANDYDLREFPDVGKEG
jgi:hypothetical protein